MKSLVAAIDRNVSGSMIAPIMMVIRAKSIVKAAALRPNDAKGRPFRDSRRLVSAEMKYVSLVSCIISDNPPVPIDPVEMA